MTSLEPRTSGEALGSALAIAMALFVLRPKRSAACAPGAAGDGMLATKFVAVNAGVRSCDGRKGRYAAAAIGPCGRSAGHRAARHIRPPERRLHLATHLHGEIVFVVGDVAPAQASALRDVAFERDRVGEPERQQALVERARGWNLLAPDAKPAFAVEHLAFL